MFKREHHKNIAFILQSIDGDFFKQHQCYFGGGTAIVLFREEYRESVDIDFVVSDLKSYQHLRNRISLEGLTCLTRPGFTLQTQRDFRLDQYGIRTMIKSGQLEIKFEIVFEARISLEASEQRICGVPILSEVDMAATKLLANSDRWSDDAINSRDLIDLAMLDSSQEILNQAIQKAQRAYGDAVLRDLKKAIDTLSRRKGRLDHCMDQLKIDEIPKALLWQKIKNLLK